MEKCLVGLLAVAALCVAGCQVTVVNGSGNVVTETRDVSGFTAVSIGCLGDAVLIQGSEEKVVVETDDNIMAHVVTEVRDGVLHLEVDRELGNANLKLTKGLKYTVYFKTLERVAVAGEGEVACESLVTDELEVAVSGAGTISFGKLAARALAIAVSGAGDIAVAGEVETQSIAISGAGSYAAGDLRSEAAVIAISGTGDARVWATGTLDAQISGTGSVSYYGEPKVTQSISGVGSINALGMHGTSV